MKRSNSSDTNNLIQVELDSTIMDKNAFLSLKKEVFSFKDLISLLPRNLTRDELICLHRQLGDEISERTSILCEMIPDDVWKKVIQTTALKDDISKLFPLKQVCKRWNGSFSSAIEEVRIKKSESLKRIYRLNSIRSLSIETEVEITNEIFTNVFLNISRLALSNKKITSTVSPDLFSQMTNLTALDLSDHIVSAESKNFINNNNLASLVNLEYLNLWKLSFIPFESLKKLVNLKELDAGYCQYTRAQFELKFGPNLQIIDHLKSLKIFSIYRGENDFLNINEIQKRYPHVRFRWHIINEVHKRGVYEGSFSEDNKMSGKGKVSYLNGGMTFTYEGEFKNDVKEGKGKLILVNGNIYEGEFSNDKMNGQGVYTWSDGRRYEGQFKNDQIKGKCVFHWPDGNRFEGDYKSGMCRLGIMYYSNGSRYAGEVSHRSREGKGIMFYSNGNRYEGIFKNNKRVGEGIFYYSNGEKVEGDDSKYILNDDEGTIEIIS